jgi:type I restriction enzyme S subunit
MREDIKRRIEQIRRGEVPEGYKKSLDVPIPEDWKVKKLGEILKIKYGKDQKDVEKKDGMYPILATGGVIGRTDRYLYDKPSVLIGRKGTIDRPMYIETPFWTVDTLFYSIIRDNNSVRFVHYLISSINWKKYSEATTLPSLSSSVIEGIKAAIPESDEQTKIAEILSTCDRVIELKKKLLEEKIKVKKWFMQTLLTCMIRVKDIENRTPYEELKKRIEQIRSGQVPEGFKRTEAGIVPSDWHEAKMGKLGRFSKGSGISKSDIEREGFPCITYGEIYTDYDYVLKDAHSFVNEHVACKSKRIHKNDLLLTGSGETVEDIGKAVAYVDDEPLYAGGDIIVFTPVGICCSVFLACTLNNGTVSRNKSKLGQGYSVVHIYSDKLKELVVAFPDYDEQIQIAEILSTVDKEIDLLNRDLELWEQKKKSLMQLLLTGIVRTKA